MAIPVTHVKKGNVVLIDGVNYKVLEHSLNTPGNKGGIVTFKLRNLGTGANISKKFNSNSSISTVFFSKVSCQYLYPENQTFVFMRNDDYEQFNLGTDILGDVMKYVALNQDVMIMYLEETPCDIELPASVALEVIEAEPSIRGDTATGVTKLCKVETGLEVKVPQHIKVGEKISIDTRSGDFQGRAKE
jgi:elongation factor P